MTRLSDIQIRDPFVLCHDGVYHLYGSTDPDIWRAPGVGFDVYRGASPGDWTTFDGPYPAFRPPDGFWSQTNFWAPEVYPWDGGFVMFATFKPVDGRRGTAVLRAPSPLGPFLPWSDGPVTPREWECLDGTLFVDDAGPWMVFCHEWQQIGVGTICAVRLSPDLRTAVGEPELLFGADEAPWAAPLPNRPPGSYVTDGPFLHRDAAGRLRLLWSSFGPDGRYRIGVATSSGDLLGPWTQADQALYDDDAGHGMVFTTPDGRRFLAVHTPNTTPHERPIFVEIAETDDGLATTGVVVR